TSLEPTGDLHRLGLVYLQLGVTDRERGDYDTALSNLTRAENLFGVLQATRLSGWAHTSIGITLLRVEKSTKRLPTSRRACASGNGPATMQAANGHSPSWPARSPPSAHSPTRKRLWRKPRDWPRNSRMSQRPPASIWP